jgi:hypothetical protein
MRGANAMGTMPEQFAASIEVGATVNGELRYYIAETLTPKTARTSFDDDIAFNEAVRALKTYVFDTRKYKTGDFWMFRAIIGDTDYFDVETGVWRLDGVVKAVIFKLVCVRKGMANSDERFSVSSRKVILCNSHKYR